jgi:hypothetical protein
MDVFMWITQLILAGVFFFTGFGKIFAYKKLTKVVENRLKSKTITIQHQQAAIIGVAEIAGALGEIVPLQLSFPNLLPLLSSAFLAILMLGAFTYHLRRKESAAPSIVLILMAILVILGRWPWWG